VVGLIGYMDQDHLTHNHESMEPWWLGGEFSARSSAMTLSGRRRHFTQLLEGVFELASLSYCLEPHRPWLVALLLACF
jgi:hypothetical protein